MCLKSGDLPDFVLYICTLGKNVFQDTKIYAYSCNILRMYCVDFRALVHCVFMLNRGSSYSQGSRLVFQSVVFQLIFATLNMFFREYSNIRQKIENPAGPIFRAIFPLSFKAKYHQNPFANCWNTFFERP